MGRLISLNARVGANAPSTAETPIMLVTIYHPSLEKPVRISSDPTVRLSIEPMVYGTKHAGEDYIYLMVGAIMPDDQENAPPKTRLVFENISKDMAAVLRGITPGTYLRADIFVVLAGTPDFIETSYRGLRGVASSYDAAQVGIELSREPFTSEPWPEGRMTASRFPSLFN
ncbi:hypothetical protein ASF34_01285 [Methylobacterium sp. Leaf106]|nr:hypothetical protein ASF34_01285 [Methylobacterium sp. Leaf106]